TMAIPPAARGGGPGPAVPRHCRRPGTARSDGTTAAPDRRCAETHHLHLRRRGRSCAALRALSWRRSDLRRVRWRARTPASAAPAIEAEAVRDIPSAVRSMFGSCARYAHSVARTTTEKACLPAIIDAAALRSRLGMAGSDPGQQQFGAQTADRSVAK